MDGFKFTMSYIVRVADINYGGHVANSAVLNFFQDARIAYLGNLGDYSEMDLGNNCGIILPEAHLQYRAEMFLNDHLQIGVKIVEMSRSALKMEYRIERNGDVTAEGWTALVCFDYEKRKPRRLDASFREKVEDYEEIKF